MTGGPLISLYLFTLAFFLGLAVIRRVPPTLHMSQAAGTGAAGAIVVAAAFPASGASGAPWVTGLVVAAVCFGTAGAVGGLLRVHRLLAEEREQGARR